MTKVTKLVNDRLTANESKTYIVGSKISIADIALAIVAFNCIENPAGPFHAQISTVIKEGEYPLVDAYFANLATELSARLTSRQPRPF